jgi:hypothetical protein
VKLAVVLDHPIKLLRNGEEDYGMTLRKLQIQQMLIPPLIRAIDLKGKPNLLLTELVLLDLLLFLLHVLLAPGMPPIAAAGRSDQVYALQAVLLV